MMESNEHKSLVDSQFELMHLLLIRLDKTIAIRDISQ